MKKKVLFSIIIFLISVSNVYAIDSCTDQELNRLKDLANNFSITTEEVIEEKEDDNKKIIDSYYKLTPHNMNKDLKIYSEFDSTYYYNVDINDMSNLTFPSDKYVFNIYSFTNNMCTRNLLRTITLDLPIYNEYYYFHKEKCKEYPDFKYCSEHIDSNDTKYSDLTDEDIDKMFDEYIKKSNINNINILKNKNVLIIIISILIIGSIGIVYYIKNKNKDKFNKKKIIKKRKKSL